MSRLGLLRGVELVFRVVVIAVQVPAGGAGIMSGLSLDPLHALLPVPKDKTARRSGAGICDPGGGNRGSRVAFLCADGVTIRTTRFGGVRGDCGIDKMMME